jgi:sarcosine oxidase delta subunit
MRPAEGECAAAAHIARPRFNLTNYMLCNKKLWMRAFYFARQNKNKNSYNIYTCEGGCSRLKCTRAGGVKNLYLSLGIHN